MLYRELGPEPKDFGMLPSSRLDLEISTGVIGTVKGRDVPLEW